MHSINVNTADLFLDRVYSQRLKVLNRLNNGTNGTKFNKYGTNITLLMIQLLKEENCSCAKVI